ncbi:FAD-dependent monooxygenase [Pleomorphovibrio marinus]|uniref:FAD-dependent monooxygenase n=1 Tax=Pleomorphovibrio marinus TaxID=2164132 RepID=UPI000E0A86A5|nr:FAD-dependent monooxygenase [Pleomorphovibrio marinus]
MGKVKVSIIGGGIAGLTTAIALQQKGIQANVYEAASEVRPVGAGLALSSNAMRVYKLLGFMDEVISQGRLMSSFALLDQKGKIITKSDSEAISKKYGLDNFLIHRYALHELLLSKLDPDTVFTNKKATAFSNQKDQVLVDFEDGSSISTDYLIVGDGIHSAIRKQLLPQSTPRYSGYTCWRAVMDNSKLKITQASETWGQKGRFGIAPLANDELYWFACINAPQNDRKMGAMKVLDLLANFKDYHDPIPRILEHTEDHQLIWNDIIDISPIGQFAFDRIVLIGDAAHATTPNLGQGACQAIEDAYVLADEMSKSDKYSKSFRAFEKRRIKRTDFIVNTSWKMGKLAQLENAMLCRIRNFGLRNLPKTINDKQLEKVFNTDF